VFSNLEPNLMHAPTPMTVTTFAELEALYGEVGEASRVKETDRLIPEYRTWIEAAPFLVLATSGPEGLDCSPRGDIPGFVRVVDDRTLLIPDRRGNNRIDSLRNIVRDPRVALLFLVPGIGETLRVNGQATISVARSAGQLQHRGHTTENRARGQHGDRVLSVLTGHRALRPVESGTTHAPRLAADRWADVDGRQRQSRWR
jgi:predicted pyridoxine 5'-phosphate oxidase superfamily flavin-nucleotide-binding protein